MQQLVGGQLVLNCYQGDRGVGLLYGPCVSCHSHLKSWQQQCGVEVTALRAAEAKAAAERQQGSGPCESWAGEKDGGGKHRRLHAQHPLIKHGLEHVGWPRHEFKVDNVVPTAS